MSRSQGGYLVSKALYDLGVRDIFTLGGGHITPVYRALHGYRYKTDRHASRAGRRDGGGRVRKAQKNSGSLSGNRRSRSNQRSYGTCGLLPR